MHVVGYGATQLATSETVSSQHLSHGKCGTLIGDGGPPGAPLLVEPGVQHIRIWLHTNHPGLNARLFTGANRFGGNVSRVPIHLAHRKNNRLKPTWVVEYTTSVPAGGDVFEQLAISYNDGRPCTSTSATYGFHLRGANS